jgi:hypothetical protein
MEERLQQGCCGAHWQWMENDRVLTEYEIVEGMDRFFIY